ncbi:MAG TPA: type I phosphomannose isomerase catalytic subunit [Terriglobales bacterium]|nr:type I phosphomannose isomerase catalytic subunit [Terriglobales bacterium]
MSGLYPFLMQPLFDPRPWGTNDLSPIYPRQFTEKIGESWLTGDNCKIQNGALAGKSLSEVSTQYQRELVGDAAPNSDRFPLLAKFLFPHEKLSVQVHPDDNDARAIGQPWGKTECWYVADAKPGAEIGLGLKRGTTRADFEKSIHENRAEELLNWIKVSKGDMIYVAGGTVHTLGPGAIIVETQQQSDTTFRLYDYGRPRELHLEHGLRVIKEQAGSGKVHSQAFSKFGSNGNLGQKLVASPYFTVERFELHGAQRFESSARTSAQILVVVRGSAAVHVNGCEAVRFGRGDALVVPACITQFEIRPEQEIEFLKSSVPAGSVLPPEVF